MALHNKFCREDLKEKIKEDTSSRLVISFYKYITLPEPEAFRNEMYKAFEALNILGRIYVAHEGINAQISLPEENIKLFKNSLSKLSPELNNIHLNIAIENKSDAFFLLKIKVRHKIVADGIDDFLFNPSDAGDYINPEKFNLMSQKDDVLIVDMRNHYEFEVGRFKNAITYSSDTFREQIHGTVKMLAPHKNKKIVLYCTGGIRCEKTSAYLKYKGFKDVSHLQGGIINYTKKVKSAQLKNNFIGKNFVFDERLGEKVSEDVIANCHQCGEACDDHTNCANEGCHLLFIQCKNCKSKFNNCCSEECKQTLALPKEIRAQQRKGIQNGQNIFNKSKERLMSRFNTKDSI